MYLSQAIELYLISRSKKLSDGTISQYHRNLNKLNQWLGSEVILKRITDFDIDGFQVSLKGKLQASTQVNYANCLRAFFKFWKSKGESDVIWEAIEGPRIPEKVPNHIEEHQFELIDAFLDESDYEVITKRLIFNLLWNTGMRIGELLALNLEDIHPQCNYTRIVTEKNGKIRMVKWSEQCHELLIKYLGIRVAMNNREELFLTPRGSKGRKTRLTARTVQRWCKWLESELGFKVNPHAFRHGKMHYILNNGGRRNDIKQIAGHCSIQSSEVYTRLNETEQSKLLDQFLPKTKSESFLYAKSKKPMYLKN